MLMRHFVNILFEKPVLGRDTAEDELKHFSDRLQFSWMGDAPIQDCRNTNEDPNFRSVSGMGSCI